MIRLESLKMMFLFGEDLIQFISQILPNTGTRRHHVTPPAHDHSTDRGNSQVRCEPPHVTYSSSKLEPLSATKRNDCIDSPEEMVLYAPRHLYVHDMTSFRPIRTLSPHPSGLPYLLHPLRYQ